MTPPREPRTFRAALRAYFGEGLSDREYDDIVRIAATPAPAPLDVLDVEALRLPWYRETIGHQSTAGIVASVAADLNVPLAEGVPPNTDATWIFNADNKVVAFVGNGPRQTDNADAIIAAVTVRAAARTDVLDSSGTE